jgi:hypothetical protein
VGRGDLTTEHFPCLSSIERAYQLLVVDLVCIVALLAGVHCSIWKRHRRDVQRERAVR